MVVRAALSRKKNGMLSPVDLTKMASNDAFQLQNKCDVLFVASTIRGSHRHVAIRDWFFF